MFETAECPVGVAALISTPVAGLGGRTVAPLLEEYAEIRGSGGVAEPVGSLVGRHRSRPVATLLEQIGPLQRSLVGKQAVLAAGYPLQRARCPVDVARTPQDDTPPFVVPVVMAFTQ